MPQRSSTTDVRERLLAAAARVVREQGVSHLTLDRVASAAAVSKGGLLYHFPNKQALLAGMLDHLLTGMRVRLERFEAGLTGEPRAVIRSFVGAEAEQQPAEREMAHALLAAAAEDPKLLAPAKSLLKTWARRIDAESEDGMLLLLAAEGLRFLSMFDLLPGGKRGHNDLLRRLKLAAEEGMP